MMTSPYQHVTIRLDDDALEAIVLTLVEKCDLVIEQKNTDDDPPFLTFYIESDDTRQAEDFLHHARCIQLIAGYELALLSLPDEHHLDLRAFASWLRAHLNDPVGYAANWEWWELPTPLSHWYIETYKAPYAVQHTPTGKRLEHLYRLPIEWLTCFRDKLEAVWPEDDSEICGRIALDVLEEVARELGVETSEPQTGPTLFDDVVTSSMMERSREGV